MVMLQPVDELHVAFVIALQRVSVIPSSAFRASFSHDVTDVTWSGCVVTLIHVLIIGIHAFIATSVIELLVDEPKLLKL